jgi:hypothetical protein
MLGVDEVCPSHGSGQRHFLPRHYKDVDMLCEAQDYVKLSFFTSGLSFIFSLWSIVYCT